MTNRKDYEKSPKVKKYREEYRKRPEVKEHKKEYEKSPKMREYRKSYKKVYLKEPEVKKRRCELSKGYRKRHPDKVRECNKRWRQKNKDKCKSYSKNFLQSHPEYHAEYREKNRDIINIKQQEARKQGKLKESDAKHSSKRRKLDWDKLWYNPFSNEEVVVWHHIDNKYVMALPKDFHMMYYGKHHKENMKIFIEQIYGEL